MELKVRALCIKVSSCKEKDKLLTLASVEMGKLNAVAKSSTAPNSKLKLAAAPLCFGEYILTKSTKGGYIVTGCTVEDNFFNCWGDVDRLGAAQIVTELLDYACFSNDENVEQLVLALKTLGAINYNRVYPFVNSAWFVVNVLRDIGVDIQAEEIPCRLKAITVALLDMLTDDLDCVELTMAELRDIMIYLDAILKRTLDKKVNSLENAINSIGGKTEN